MASPFVRQLIACSQMLLKSRTCLDFNSKAVKWICQMFILRWTLFDDYLMKEEGRKEERKAGRKGRREMNLVKWITITVYMNDLVASLSFVFYFASLMRSLPDFFCFFYWRWVGRGEWWGMPPPAVEGHLPGQPSCLLPSQAEVSYLTHGRTY